MLGGQGGRCTFVAKVSAFPLSPRTELSTLSLDTHKYAREAQSSAILASLNYSKRPLRQYKIQAAQRKTFEWSLKDLTRSMKRSGSLRRFLSGDDGLFWVSGKPGSGKPTLIRFGNGILQSAPAWASFVMLAVQIPSLPQHIEYYERTMSSW